MKGIVKEKTITIKVSEKEKKAILKGAKRLHNQNVSEFIRNAVSYYLMIEKSN